MVCFRFAGFNSSNKYKKTKKNKSQMNFKGTSASQTGVGS